MNLISMKFMLDADDWFKKYGNSDSQEITEKILTDFMEKSTLELSKIWGQKLIRDNDVELEVKRNIEKRFFCKD